MASFLDPIKNIFSVKHKGATLGVDIGSSSIKIVLLEKIEEKAVLRNYGEIVLGPRAGVAAGQATNLSPEKIAEAIHDLLLEMGVTARHTLLAIPFSASLLSVIELPDVGQKELKSMVPLEARRYIPVPVSEVSLDWWVLPKRKKKKVAVVSMSPLVPVAPAISEDDDEKPVGNVDVIIAAIHNETLKKYETIERDAHLPGEMSHFEIEIFSMLRAVVGRDLATALVIDIGAGSTKLALVDEGLVRGSHIVSLGGQDITLALARSQNISFAQAEEIKCRVGMMGDEEGRDVAAAADLILGNIMSEAVRFAENHERKYEMKVAKVVLVGGGARLSGVEKITAKKFPHASVTAGNPFTRVDTPAFLDATLKEIGPNFVVALGIALKGLEE
ncbi:MAG: pilus assembly protein PilM [Candidatus Yonathbacteria bacterium]|nr:pilus assembly protein PilM [Candidatus Yonathbacteria bacterium]